MANIYSSITTGVVALATLGVSVTFSEVVQAAAFSVATATAPGFTFVEADKRFSNFVVTGSTTEAADQIAITFVSGNFQVDYTSTGGTIAALQTGGTLSYTVEILPGFINEFAFAGTDAQGGPLGQTGNFSKSLASNGLTTLTFVNGGAAPFGAFDSGIKTINVVSTWTINSGNINSFSDKFTQNPVQPEPPTGVPEPSAVLGMLALGLAGFARRKKA
jgi:hypothetical protein